MQTTKELLPIGSADLQTVLGLFFQDDDIVEELKPVDPGDPQTYYVAPVDVSGKSVELLLVVDEDCDNPGVSIYIDTIDAWARDRVIMLLSARRHAEVSARVLWRYRLPGALEQHELYEALAERLQVGLRIH